MQNDIIICTVFCNKVPRRFWIALENTPQKVTESPGKPPEDVLHEP